MTDSPATLGPNRRCTEQTEHENAHWTRARKRQANWRKTMSNEEPNYVMRGVIYFIIALLMFGVAYHLRPN